MLKFEKIQDKDLVLVQGQTNCSVKGQSLDYKDDKDCLTDCGVVYAEPLYYKSSHT